MRIRLVIKCIKIALIMVSIIWSLVSIADKYLYKTKIAIRPIGTRSYIKQIEQNHSTFIVLFWTKYFDDSIENYIAKNAGQLSCLSRNCVLTSDRAYLAFSNAVIFHWRDLKSGDMPSLRRSDQLWTLYNLEAPTYTHFLFDDNLKFNLTASYRTDSDIYVPYGRIVGRNTSIDNYINQIDFKSKSKSVVWFVSNCETPGKRELYVEQLNKYIKIDTIGKCGQLSCDPPRSEQCFEKVAKKYKFILSFENSICRDYVTEKLFEALNYDIIPIVFGGSDYKSLMPFNSYIDANKLTPKQLSQHIIQIGSDEDMYMSYFNWKHSYYVEAGLDTRFEIFCKLCQIIGNKHLTYSSHSTSEIIEWWFDRANCKTWAYR